MIGPDCVQQTLADASRPPPDLAFDPVSSTGLCSGASRAESAKSTVKNMVSAKFWSWRTRKIENTSGGPSQVRTTLSVVDAMRRLTGAEVKGLVEFFN
jgi:hypothetical protein